MRAIDQRAVPDRRRSELLVRLRLEDARRTLGAEAQRLRGELGRHVDGAHEHQAPAEGRRQVRGDAQHALGPRRSVETDHDRLHDRSFAGRHARRKR
jgi:hypothetical protein